MCYDELRDLWTDMPPPHSSVRVERPTVKTRRNGTTGDEQRRIRYPRIQKASSLLRIQRKRESVKEISHFRRLKKIRQKISNIKKGVKKIYKMRVKRVCDVRAFSITKRGPHRSGGNPSRFCSIVIYLRDETDKPEAKRFITVRNAIWLITINTNRFHTEAVHAARPPSP